MLNLTIFIITVYSVALLWIGLNKYHAPVCANTIQNAKSVRIPSKHCIRFGAVEVRQENSFFVFV